MLDFQKYVKFAAPYLPTFFNRSFIWCMPVWDTNFLIFLSPKHDVEKKTVIGSFTYQSDVLLGDPWPMKAVIERVQTFCRQSSPRSDS